MKRLSLKSAAFWAVLLIVQGCSSNSPVEVVKRYIGATYSWDYSKAYELISEADKKIQTFAEYKESRGLDDPIIEERARLLAPYIRYEPPEVSIDRDRATVRIVRHLPSWSAISFKRDVKKKLKSLHRSGDLPMIKAEETFQLVKEKGRWRIFLNWAEAVIVMFEAEVKGGLPWEFGVKKGRVIARPGEMLKVSYWARNISDEEATGIASRIVAPKEAIEYLEVVRCFCLLEETLKAGEGKEMSLVLRVSRDIPEGVRSYRIRIEFYPIESWLFDTFSGGELKSEASSAWPGP